MDKLIIEGGTPIHGKVQVSGAKNAALPILLSAILTDQECLFSNVPDLADITTTIKLIRELGFSAEQNGHQVSVCAKEPKSIRASYDLVRTMRASILVLGPLLARFGKAEVSLPGGCAIGARPVNLHLTALEQMGAQIELTSGYVHASAKKLKGAEIHFPIVSVGATENTMMAATLAEGTTVLKNAAREPEIVDLANFLKTMGADIQGEGTSEIRIQGVPKLQGGKHSIIPDRIEAGTFLVAALISNGSVELPGVSSYLVGATLEKLREAGAEISETPTSIQLRSVKEIQPFDLETHPFPGFATDMQAQFMSLACVANGTSNITESIFENRFMHVAELRRLGAEIEITGNQAKIIGHPLSSQQSLTGATVMATDLRASASLVLAGLAARGTTTLRRIYHLDRGYERMEEKLSTVGAKIRREHE
ncbi:MAG: UDP-N-acetylglucosamine 1-carboxyvinyltransferase [Bacteriovoracia bacterium]